MFNTRKDLYVFIRKICPIVVFSAIFIGIYTACVTPGGGAKEPEFGLQVIPHGPSSQTWTNKDGKIYTITWEKPVYKKVPK